MLGRAKTLGRPRRRRWFMLSRDALVRPFWYLPCIQRDDERRSWNASPRWRARRLANRIAHRITPCPSSVPDGRHIAVGENAGGCRFARITGLSSAAVFNVFARPRELLHKENEVRRKRSLVVTPRFASSHSGIVQLRDRIFPGIGSAGLAAPAIRPLPRT